LHSANHCDAAFTGSTIAYQAPGNYASPQYAGTETRRFQPLLFAASRQGFHMSIVELTKDSFQEAITPDGTLIVDFWAPWCGPCRGFAPVFEQAATEHPDVTFAKVNTDVEQELAGALGIRSIPTLMVFREKVLLFSQPGALSGGQLNELLAKIKEVDMEKVHQEIAAAQDSQDA